jgi:protein gp37
MKPKPLPQNRIPQTWSAAQALAIVDFLQAIAGEIWDWYERPIFDLMERTNQHSYDTTGKKKTSSKQDRARTTDQEIPF